MKVFQHFTAPGASLMYGVHLPHQNLLKISTVYLDQKLCDAPFNHPFTDNQDQIHMDRWDHHSTKIKVMAQFNLFPAITN